jgi:ABC-2 type transport system permease protein
MKFRKIFQFEFGYQLRSLTTWIYFALALLFPCWFSFVVEPTEASIFINGPYFLLFITVFVSGVWTVISGALAGHAAARDVQSRIYPLIYTASITKLEYLGGRFVAALVLNGFITLVIQLSLIISFYVLHANDPMLSPFRPEVYLTHYGYLSIPLVFVITAFQFSISQLERKAVTAYAITIFLFPIFSLFMGMSIAKLFDSWEIRKFFDLVGIHVVASTDTWTPFEKNNRLIALEGPFLWSRILWISAAIGILCFTYFRFQFIHHTDRPSRFRVFRRKRSKSRAASSELQIPSTGLIFENTPGFKLSTYVSQVRTIAWSSFRYILKNKIGLVALAILVIQLLLAAHEILVFRGVPQYATAMNVLKMVTPAINDPATPLVLIQMLIIFFAGEIIWREREAGVNTISDATPVTEWIILLGKFIGLALNIALWMGIFTIGSIIVQLMNGAREIDAVIYLKALFGLQLITYLIFAMAAMAIHALVNQKYIGIFVSLAFFLYMVAHGKIGIEHNLLVYASDPGWSYTDIRGFDPSLEAWFWFKAYWIGWALLLAVVARLFLVRSMSKGFKVRLDLARERFTKTSKIMALIGMTIVVLAGSFIFYNTNILNDYNTSSDKITRQANYELKYKKFKNVSQPTLTESTVHVELYPSKRKADVHATYRTVNKTNAAIDSIHITIIPELETSAITFDRGAQALVEDNDSGYRIYKLDKPILPGESMGFEFDVHFRSRGFTNHGVDPSVIENGTYFINYDWLPAIGYSMYRETRNDVERKKHGLAAWSFPSLYDPSANKQYPGQELIDYEAIIGTEEGQIATTAGKQIKQWNENGRAYFHYKTSAPIRNTYSFLSANYKTKQLTWIDSSQNNREVDINIYYHPKHEENIDRIARSARASLTYYAKQFGSYPYNHLTITERSGYHGSLNAEPTVMDYGESFTLSNLNDHPEALDIIYFAIAHEVAHQYWGSAQLLPAHVEGAPVMSETLANYSALKVMEDSFGEEQVRSLLSMWRQSFDVPRSVTMTPLLKALDPFLGYRKGPLALYALMKYTHKDSVNHALDQLMKKHKTDSPPYATSLDLYRELKAVTPDSLHYLLRDYFEKNVYWNLKTDKATTKQIDSTTWEVTLNLRASKVTYDSTGKEIDIPMNDWIEIGVSASSEDGKRKSLYLKKHRIHSGEQTIIVQVNEKPYRGGIDPNYLLFDMTLSDNTKVLK